MTYTVVPIGVKAKEKVYSTRDAALEYMYKLCSKYKLDIKETWEDHHDKAYICSNGVEIHINRD